MEQYPHLDPRRHPRPLSMMQMPYRPSPPPMGYQDRRTSMPVYFDYAGRPVSLTVPHSSSTVLLDSKEPMLAMSASPSTAHGSSEEKTEVEDGSYTAHNYLSELPRVQKLDCEAVREEEEPQDVFGDHESHDIHYKTLSWPFIAMLMIAEIVSNGVLSLPQALATIGLVPAIIIIVFLGAFALFTAKLLIDFKLNHPEVHNMGDAGYILFGPLGREILSLGTVIFAIFATGSELLSGQQALSTLSNNGLCSTYLVVIFAAVTFLLALPRTLSRFRYVGIGAAGLIVFAGVIAMIGAGTNPTEGRTVKVVASSDFSEAFLAVTNPVFAYAGHFMFFILMSEMRKPKDAMKAACCLQGFSTVFYVVFSVIMYVYLGDALQSPVLLSLPPLWSKVTFAIALGNFLIAGALYSHTAAKLVFVRFFRHTHHIYNNTRLGWTVWVVLLVLAVGTALVLSIAVPIFSYLVSIAAVLFASWYTYGLAGFFWMHDAYHLDGGAEAFQKRPVGTVLAMLTILLGAFICGVGTWVSVKLIVDAYHSGAVGHPFTC